MNTPRKDSGNLSPADDPNFKGKPAYINRPPEAIAASPAPDDRKDRFWGWVILLAVLGPLIVVPVWVAYANRPVADRPATPTTQPFGFVMEERLTISADGKSGYLLTADGKLFRLDGDRATEVQPTTSPGP